jgi:hypothetical protein
MAHPQCHAQEQISSDVKDSTRKKQEGTTAMNRAYDDALQDAVFYYTRCQWQMQNNKREPGKCFPNDVEIYKVTDVASLDEERCYNLIENLKAFAQHHANWDRDLEDWCGEVLNRNPIQIRTKAERWKSTRNNHQMWKLIMQYQEEVTRRLEEGINENHSTFSQHFEFTKA